MKEAWDEPPFLDGYRVLDLTNERGLLCGRTLGDWGADVIKIERPGGDPVRNTGPFVDDDPDPEKSLYWMATNVNKRSITLNIENADGKDLFKKLAETADFVVESFDPGYMDDLGLGYAELEKINPRLIMTSITPFGGSGPYSRFQASDMTLWAMGGMMNLCGDDDSPPIQVSLPQSYFHGGLHGAVGSMTALYYRELTGEGQHVDVSIQEAVDFVNMVADETYDILGVNLSRSGPFYSQVRPEPLGPLRERVVWPCKDGYVSILVRGGAAGVKASTKALVQWMREENAAGMLDDYDWDTYNFAVLTQEERERIEKPVIDFLKTKTKKELSRRAVKDNMIFAPLSTMEDLLENEQLHHRGYWIKVDYPEFDREIIHPGAVVQTTAFQWRIFRRAPFIGEHNKKIYLDELGLTKEALISLKEKNVI